MLEEAAQAAGDNERHRQPADLHRRRLGRLLGPGRRYPTLGRRALEMVDEAMDTGDLRARVVALENWRVQRDIESARHDERWKHMDTKIDGVEKKVDKISSDISRVMWLILAGIVMAIVTFMIKGGFAS
ncbi:hypothetical protein [Mesorhizobium sp.]|uniref:hypothetical protein n=1 Tax=Mesorhizobium sp. TaxID=1871066 RepID=UPI0025D3EE65|nr:hypothetical protein [Mesorhizobium sp.]